MSTVVLITGANRGIGHGLLSRYLALPDHTVIAAVRDPSHPTTKALDGLPKANGSKLVTVKIEARQWNDPFAAVKELQAQGIDHLDIVIANAAIANISPLVIDAKEDDLRTHFETNAMGNVSLYQAVYPLLKESKKQPEPMFLTIGTDVASFGYAHILARFMRPPLTSMSTVEHSAPFPFPNGVYGPSKAAAHWISAKINVEDPWLNSFAIHPGSVRTDMGEAGAVMFKMDEATRATRMITPDQSCDGIMKVLAGASKATHGGKLFGHSGNVIPW